MSILSPLCLVRQSPKQLNPLYGLAPYFTEGAPKQDDDTLRALQEWIDELLAYRRNVAADVIATASLPTW